MQKAFITLLHGMYEDFPCFCFSVSMQHFLYEDTSSPRESLESAQQNIRASRHKAINNMRYIQWGH